MYIKLNYSADQPLNYIFRVVNEIINTTGITSVATLQSTATSASWHATLLQNLDATNSEIIRTGSGTTGLTTAKTVSHYCKNGTSASYTDEHAWTVEFSRYDDNTKKYYVQHINTAGAANNVSAVKIADGLSSGTLSGTTAMAPTQAPLATTSVGGIPTFNSSTYTQTASTYIANDTSGFTKVRSFFMYISDFGMVWCATSATTYNVGFGNTYSDSTKFIGPFIYSQYTRFDYHNTNANGITPLLFTNPGRGTGYGFGASTNDWTAVENTQYATNATACAFRVFNLINAYPSTSASFPVVTQPMVNWGIGSRYTDYAGLTGTQNGANVLATATYGAVIFTTVGTRFPSADLKSQAYGMLPVSWRNLYYYNAGGDASAKAGWYCFNGDYYPGDEFSYGGKTYKILPTWTGYSNRVGIAIPKE